MWELLVAVIGGTFLFGKVLYDKSAQKQIEESFEERQYWLRKFRESVTNDRMVSAVKEYMLREDSYDSIVSEISEIFEQIPELRGKEKYWLCHNSRPPASNWRFIEFILCINRKCVPITSQYTFTIMPYYIGNDSFGSPKYVSMSDAGREIFMNWVIEKLKTYGINVNLKYTKDSLNPEFIWTTDK